MNISATHFLRYSRRHWLSPLLLALSLLPGLSYAAQAESESMARDERKYLEWAQSIWDSLDRQSGEIRLAGEVATLKVPENFYYLSPADTEKVLVEVWGNPPGGTTLGMLFPEQYTPFDSGSWGVTINYEEDGYVSDENADSIDYGELLEQMKADVAESSEQRVAQGYEKIALVGWAESPRYDSASKKMYWAKELAFGDNSDHTLNYNIRVLGRKGVLVINFIAGMEQLPEISSNLQPVMAMADFDSGYRYEDFDPDLDEVAAYGLGALVAGKVLAKTGFLAVALLALKKFWIIGVVAVFGFARALFRRKKRNGGEEQS